MQDRSSFLSNGKAQKSVVQAHGSSMTQLPSIFALLSSAYHIHPQHMFILKAVSWSKRAAGAPAFFTVFVHSTYVLQVGSLALFIMITRGSILLRAATILKVTVPWAEGKRALELFPW